jgi:hypothetical protein
MRCAAASRFALETMALVWPRKAFVFQQVLIRGRQVEDVARELGVNERTVRRDLEGHGAELGAEEWFLILLELYREADCIQPDGGDVLHDAFLATHSAAAALGPFHASFAVMVLKSFGGGDEQALLHNLPWERADAPVLVAWPVHGLPAPLERSLLPALLGALARSHGDNRYWLCWLSAQLAGLGDGAAWRALFELMNPLTRVDEVPADRKLLQAQTKAAVLLATQPPATRCALMGVLACTPLSWPELCRHAGHPRFGALDARDRVAECAAHYLRASSTGMERAGGD